MSAKTSANRRAAFFTAVRETGNQTIAAERAKVSRSWVSLHRLTDPAFRVELDAAIAAAKVALAGAAKVGPGAGWRAQDGEELAVRGSNGRRVQIARARLKQWTPRVEARFLSVLGATCNVKAACAAVGLSQESAYQHRRRWPDFADRWHAALTLGCERLEGELFLSAGRLFGTVEADEDAPMTPMTPAQALQLLALNRHTMHGGGRPPGARSRRPTPTREEVDRALMQALDREARITAQKAAKAERAAARRAARAGLPRSEDAVPDRRGPADDSASRGSADRGYGLHHDTDAARQA